jgi:hypothetical protein
MVWLKGVTITISPRIALVKSTRASSRSRRQFGQVLSETLKVLLDLLLFENHRIRGDQFLPGSFLIDQQPAPLLPQFGRPAPDGFSLTNVPQAYARRRRQAAMPMAAKPSSAAKVEGSGIAPTLAVCR